MILDQCDECSLRHSCPQPYDFDSTTIICDRREGKIVLYTEQ